jgi:hypothetical protein
VTAISSASSFETSKGTQRRFDINRLPSVVTISGLALFIVAAIIKSLALTHFAAGVSSVGLLAVPAALAMTGRLATMPKGRLLLGTVFIVQGLHTVEHIVQLIQSYRLDYPPVRSLGIVSKLNVEWVHFGWNWIAWLGVVVAWKLGARGASMVVLFAWITAHSLEHSYMLWHYLTVLKHLDALKLPPLGSSEVLPGFFGRDGWLSRELPARRELLGPLASAPRVAVHFWWNVGEVLLMAVALLVTRSWASTMATPLNQTRKSPKK